VGYLNYALDVQTVAIHSAINKSFENIDQATKFGAWRAAYNFVQYVSRRNDLGRMAVEFRVQNNIRFGNAQNTKLLFG
jgi:hypothetical protein